MLNQYETVFIVTPVLSEAQVKETVQQTKDTIVKNGGEILDTENWGLKKLAYPIQKKTTGFYNLLSYKAPAETMEKLNVFFRREEKIFRFINIKLDKHSIAYAEKRIERLKKDTNNTKEEK